MACDYGACDLCVDEGQLPADWTPEPQGGGASGTGNENDGYVSLWISDEADEARVEAAFAVNYAEDGEWIPPAFAKAFGFVRFNPSTREATVLSTATASVREALAGFSYDEVIAERFANAFGGHLASPAKSVALLYDFQFEGTPSGATVDGSSWTYVGCVKYEL